MLNIVILTNFERGGGMLHGNTCVWVIMVFERKWGSLLYNVVPPNVCAKELFPYIPVYIFHKNNVIPGIRNANVFKKKKTSTDVTGVDHKVQP